MHNIPDDPRRVAGPDELVDDRQPDRQDDTYKDLIEADDAERIYRGNLLQDCDSVHSQLNSLFTDFNSVFGSVK